MKTIIFGASEDGIHYIKNCPDDEFIVAICDNKWKEMHKRGYVNIFGHKILAPEIIPQLEFDKVVICIDELKPNRTKYICEVRDQLLNWMQIEKIQLLSYDNRNDHAVEYPRVEFLRNLSNDFKEININGNVAECGVCWGEFASKINRFFPDKKLYLFDTFSSFDDRDIEQEIGDHSNALEVREILATANPDMVYLRMPHKHNCIFKQGYVPDTFVGLEDEKFCFVHLDMDLYAPTLAGLRFFADRMVDGGVILVHDYYVPILDGVRRAVLEFANERKILKMPIGDDRSVAITIL